MRALLLLTLLACEESPSTAPPANPVPAVTPVKQLDVLPETGERLSAEYPGARRLRAWRGGVHAHSLSWATVDPPAKVRAYYRRYAIQQHLEAEETATSTELHGSSPHHGLMRIGPPGQNDEVQPGEQTVISSSRP